jgi:hypothetical protein
MLQQREDRVMRCADCRDGEHENYDDNVLLVTVRDPDKPGPWLKRANLCESHRVMYSDDGYEVS